MLKTLKLHNVGPADDLQLGPLAERLNLLTGDNGLGKTFLLDAIWFGVTRTWPGEPARPRPGTPVQELAAVGGDSYFDATIEVSFYPKTSGTRRYPYRYHRTHEEWYAPISTASGNEVDRVNESVHPGDGIVIYSRVDGGFSVWDANRNPGRRELPGAAKTRPRAYHFSPSEVWKGNKFCKGLIDDWVLWQGRRDPAFAQLEHVLKKLEPAGAETLEPGTPRRLSLDNPQEFPTLRMPYGHEVPVAHLSAAYRRVISLAYMLTWAWTEHLEACKLMGKKPTEGFLFLIDELDAHLHPRWQRTILRSLLGVVDSMTQAKLRRPVQLQLIASTHAPLVLASAEPIFDVDRDAVWELDLVERQVRLEKFPWERRGDASAWLTSKVFDLGIARSLEAEEAIQAAMALTRADAPDPEEIKTVTQRLREVLSDTDRLWVRWAGFAAKHGVET